MDIFRPDTFPIYHKTHIIHILPEFGFHSAVHADK